MKKPVHPEPVIKWDYEDNFTEKSHHKTTFVPDGVDDFCLEDNYFYDGLEGLNKKELYNDNLVIDLRSLLSKIPKGVNPSRVKIYLRRPRMMDYFQIDVVEEVVIDKKKQKAEYNAALEEYNKKMEVYEKDLKKYEEWEKQKKIEHHKKELEKLEK